ncbi:MAG: hypothetical protein M3Z41_04965, partial [Candidatus Eremiobacteraeota bacterium]|nr:hypothetical protein [Candidatus Eremiobacteraeota bacterium]
TIVAETEDRIRALPRNAGDIFALVAKEGATRNGTVDFEKSNLLVSDLLKQYHLVDYRQFPGLYESVSLYLLR